MTSIDFALSQNGVKRYSRVGKTLHDDRCRLCSITTWSETIDHIQVVAVVVAVVVVVFRRERRDLSTTYSILFSSSSVGQSVC
jgi:hypothetical protein